MSFIAVPMFLVSKETATIVTRGETLTDQQDGWIKVRIQSGHYTNDSEYIRDLIRREQERAAQIDALRAALIEGESSGAPQPFDVQAFKARMTMVHG